MQKNHRVCSEYVGGPYLIGNRHPTSPAHGTRFDTAKVDITSSRSGHHEGSDGMRCRTIHKNLLLLISINGSSIRSVDGSTSIAEVPSTFPSMSIETHGRRPDPERSRSHRKGALDGRNSELDDVDSSLGSSRRQHLCPTSILTLLRSCPSHRRRDQYGIRLLRKGPRRQNLTWCLTIALFF